MSINVKTSLCNITRASKLFQRNNYLPLLKPLSPKDALRRKCFWTGQVTKYEHYIPVLQTHFEKMLNMRKWRKDAPVVKRRVKMREGIKYVQPSIDDRLENHAALEGILRSKGEGQGQYYVYVVPDKNCAVVINYQMERAIKDGEISDVMIAHRSEKIVAKLHNGLKINLPLTSYNESSACLYRGSGWTKFHAEYDHHHGQETFYMTKFFEAKELGVEEQESSAVESVEARKKKKKCKLRRKRQQVSAGYWDELGQIVEQTDATGELDDLEKTKYVGSKLKSAGLEILSQLPTLQEVAEVVKILDSGELCELHNISGLLVKLSADRTCFVIGQIIKTSGNAIFVPGQTIEGESGSFEYTPGITVLVDGEPALVPGLVTGENGSAVIFLPGQSTVKEGGQLQFRCVEEHRNQRVYSHDDPEVPGPYSRQKPSIEEEIVIKRRVFADYSGKEKVRKKPNVYNMVKKVKKKKSPPPKEFKPQRQPKEDPLISFQERMRQQEEEEKKRIKERRENSQREEERKVDSLRLQIRRKCKSMVFETPKPYKPMEPVLKSPKLVEYEDSITKGTFFDDDNTRQILERARSSTRQLKYMNAMSAYDFKSGSLGFGRL